MAVSKMYILYKYVVCTNASRDTGHMQSGILEDPIVYMDMHVHIRTHILQGEELLSACCAGSTADVSALLGKGADVHFIGKVERVNALLYNYGL